MISAWPAIYTVLFIGILLVLVIRYQVQAFIALLLASLGLGLASGMNPTATIEAMGRGVGDLLAGVMIILALGAILGRMLEASGAAEVIAESLVSAFGEKRASFAMLLASFLVGIPVLFNVGFLLLVPIVYRLQRQTGSTLIAFLVPMSLGLGVTHSLVPPHPGIVGAVGQIAPQGEQGRVMVETILFGTPLALVMALVGWWATCWWVREEMVTVPEQFADAAVASSPRRPSFALSLLIVVMPLLLSLMGFGMKLLNELKLVPRWMSQPWTEAPAPRVFAIAGNTLLDWLVFLGNPTMALFVSTGLAFWLLGGRLGFDRKQLAKIADKGLNDVGPMVYLFGAAGGFSAVIKGTGADGVIADVVQRLPISPIATGFFVAVLVRIALGSATAAVLTASPLMAKVAASMPGQETLLVLSVAVGVTFGTQPADSGFWMVKEYGNLSFKGVLLHFNGIRVFMALVGIAILLLAEWLLL
jgi:gluconate transporter